MTFDVAREVGLIKREVSDTERDGKPARVVRASRTYDTTVDDLWDAVTNAERIPRWFLPVSGELRLGGRYQLQGNAGGTITQCDPPRSFAATWEMGDAVTWLEVRISADPKGGARLELEHTAPVDPKWGEFGPGAVGIGWDLTLQGLGRHLASGAAVDPAAAAAWTASDEGKQFMRGSSDGWCEADIAGGADAAAAKAAAARTFAAYTGG